MNKSYNIREVQKTDIDACADVIRRSFATVAKEFGLTRENCPTNGAFMENSRLAESFADGVFMFVIYDNGEIAGFASLEDYGGGVFEMGKLAVIPPCRHKGYGKALLDYAKIYVQGCGGNKITVGIIEENTVLKNWYAKSGFIHTGIRIIPSLPFTVGFMEWSALQRN